MPEHLRDRRNFAPEAADGGGATPEESFEVRAARRKSALDRHSQENVAHALNRFDQSAIPGDDVENGRRAIDIARSLHPNENAVFLDSLMLQRRVQPEHIGRAANAAPPDDDSVMGAMLAGEAPEGAAEPGPQTKDEFVQVGLDAQSEGRYEDLEAILADAHQKLSRQDYYEFGLALQRNGIHFSEPLENPANDAYLPLTYRQITDRLGQPTRIGNRARYWRLPSGDAMLFPSTVADNTGNLVPLDGIIEIDATPYRLDETGLAEMRERPAEREIREYAKVKTEFWRQYERGNKALYKALWDAFDHLATVEERRQLCKDVADVKGPAVEAMVWRIYGNYVHERAFTGPREEKITFEQASSRFEGARIDTKDDLSNLYEQVKKGLPTKDMAKLRKWMGGQDWLDQDMVKEVLDEDSDFKPAKKVESGEKKDKDAERARVVAESQARIDAMKATW